MSSKKGFNLSNKVLGCKHCLGAWIPFTDVERFIRELRDKQFRDEFDNAVIHIYDIDKLAGEKFKDE